uniref:Uncharacterized protein n=1 Tax=Fervidicoccus fontis TaxID=683846 RepID=A0A7J3ZJN5_9CREN
MRVLGAARPQTPNFMGFFERVSGWWLIEQSGVGTGLPPAGGATESTLTVRMAPSSSPRRPPLHEST